MMRGISKFITGDGNGELSSWEDRLLERFKEESKGLDKKGRRQLEERLLLPVESPKYFGSSPDDKFFSEKSVRLVFGTKKEFELFSKYFSVNQYKEFNVSNLDLLFSFH